MTPFARAIAVLLAASLASPSAIAAGPQAKPAGARTAPIASERAEIVRRDGVRIEADRAWLDSDRRSVGFRRAGRDRDESAPWPEIAAILWRSPPTARDPSMLLSLQTGERFPGSIERQGEAIRFAHPWLGSIEIDLDKARSIEIVPGTPAGSRPRDASGDRVALANGDAIEGLVTSLGARCEIESLEDGSARSFPLEVVARVDFLDSPQPPGPIRLEARDGTVVDVPSIRSAPPSRGERPPTIAIPRRAGAPQGPEIALPLEDFSAILFEPAGIVPLAALLPRVGPAGGESPRWIPEPERAGGAAPLAWRDVEIAGPAIVRYAVAPGTILSARAILPDTMRRFGDFELVLRDGPREVLRHRFSREDPEVPIAARIDSGELVLELREGRHGPVQDRLRLAAGLLIAP